MKNSPRSNVRLVRCPGCGEILSEPTDVPVYKCGGCGTILQAKYYRRGNERRETVSESSGSGPTNEVEQRARGGEASSSSTQLVSSAQGSSGQNEGINQSSAPNGDFEKLGVSSSSREASSLNQFEQQPPSSSAQHFLELGEQREQNPSNLVPENGEVEGDHSSVEQDRDSKASSYNEPVEQPAQVASENGEVRQDEIFVEEQLEVADSGSEAASFEATTAKSEKKTLSRWEADEPSLHRINNSSQMAAEEGKVEGSSSEAKEEQLGVSNFTDEPSLSNEPTVGAEELPSQLGSANEEVVKCESEVSSTHDPVFTLKRKDSSSQFLIENQGESDNAVTSSNEPMFPENRESSQLVTENQEMDEGGQREGGQVVDTLPSEIISPAGVSFGKTDEPASLVQQTEKISGLNLSLEAEVSTAPDEHGNGGSHQTVEANSPSYGNNRVSASPTSEYVMEAEVVNLANISQKTVRTNPREKMKELQKATETKDDGTSHKDLRKSPTRNSFAYDGSVSSCDGNDNQVADQIPCQTMRPTNKAEDPVAEHKRQYFSGSSMTCSDSAFQSQIDNSQAFSAGESHQSAEQSTPPLLGEIKMSEALGHGPHKRNRMRPRIQEFLPGVPLCRRSQAMPCESRSHLAHEEFYDHPIHCPPYRQLHRSDLDRRMFAKAGWMGEELHMHPYHAASGEIYGYPRHQMYHYGGRQMEYRPLVHRMAQIPYSRERGRSHYRFHDPYSHFPPPSVCYSRGWYIPREPFDSYATASPQVFTDSEYYDWSHDTISEDQRQRDQRTSRLQLRRRNSQPVQHLQPIGGAAPFITCYQCSELLQLPPDFLLFKGIRIHRVKCSACSRILKFALEKGCHLVPYAPKRGEFEKNLKLASTSQDNHDHEALHRRSVSASVYAGSSQVRNAEKESLYSSSGAPERQKSRVAGKHTDDKGKSKMVEMHSNNTAATSSDISRHSKVTWELPARSNSPLHQLMGYSSLRAVFYGSGSGDSETR